MEEETLRKMAVEQYLRGKTPVWIYREMGRSKYWFFKWLHRYQSGDPDWYRDQPRVPRSHPHQTHPDTRKLILNIRSQLEGHPYAQIGTSAIKWEFNKLGLTPPSDSTINRILRRGGLVKKNSIYSQRGGIPLFSRGHLFQQYPSSRSHGTKIHQRGWQLLLAQCHRPLQPSSLSSSPTKKRRPDSGPGLDRMLEEDGYSRLSPSRQRTLFSGKQSLPSILWHCSQTLSFAWDRSGFYPYRRTLA